jgi:hypothetical protein
LQAKIKKRHRRSQVVVNCKRVGNVACCGKPVHNPEGNRVTPMKKKLVVDKDKFDTVLAKLLKMKPMPMKSLKTRGRRGSKAPLLPPER